MNPFETFGYCGSCASAKKDCHECGGCGPAAYDCEVSLTVDPYNSDIWNFDFCGKIFPLNAPQSRETDTTLSTNYSNAGLIYSAEKHTDTITGAQLGSLIRVEDLRDTECDYDTPAMCYELIYHKYGECGDGCKSVENGWSTFSIDNKDAKRDYLHYVRGVNLYGCPYFLDEPLTPTQWYWSGWRTEGQHNEFGYFQPRHLTSRNFPKNAKGSHIFVSEMPGNKEPVVSALPLDCLFSNILGNLGLDIQSEWSVIEQTEGFGATFDNMTGGFTIRWTDWNDPNQTQRAGYGEIKGQLAWDLTADIYTGVITVHITSVNFYSAKWTADQGVTASNLPTLHVYAVNLNTGAQTEAFTQTYKNSWSSNKTTTVACDVTLTINPGQQPLEPLNFTYIWVDWDYDDKGYLGARFKPRLSGWNDCYDE